VCGGRRELLARVFAVPGFRSKIMNQAWLNASGTNRPSSSCIASLRSAQPIDRIPRCSVCLVTGSLRWSVGLYMKIFG
jgi:hypothetical protein